MRLEGKTAVVTGAAKGMGTAITLTLAREGADILLTARDVDPLEAVAVEVRKLDRRAEVIGCDVSDEAQVEVMAARAREVFDGRIDILVNVAGVTGPIETPAWNIAAEDFIAVLDVNVRGTFLPIKHIIPSMIERRSGSIINIGGSSGLRGYKYRAAYSSSKWAVRGLTRTIALDAGEHTSTSTWSVPASSKRPAWTSCARKRRGCAVGRSNRSTTNTSPRWRSSASPCLKTSPISSCSLPATKRATSPDRNTPSTAAGTSDPGPDNEG